MTGLMAPLGLSAPLPEQALVLTPTKSTIQSAPLFLRWEPLLRVSRKPHAGQICPFET